jgi:hypothetical protein
MPFKIFSAGKEVSCKPHNECSVPQYTRHGALVPCTQTVCVANSRDSLIRALIPEDAVDVWRPYRSPTPRLIAIKSKMSSLSHLSPSELSQMPAAQPPPEVLSNLKDPVDRAPMFVAVVSVLFCLTLAFYLIRVYTKLYILRKISWDDCMSCYILSENLTDDVIFKQL